MSSKDNPLATPGKPERYHRRPAVEVLVQKKKSALYADMRAGLFPQPVRIGRRAVAWRESDLAAWQAARQKAGGHS